MYVCVRWQEKKFFLKSFNQYQILTIAIKQKRLMQVSDSNSVILKHFSEATFFLLNQANYFTRDKIFFTNVLSNSRSS